MTFTAIVLALFGLTTSAGGGYLVGTALGRKARRDLDSRHSRETERIRELELQLATRTSSAKATEQARDDIREIIAPLLGQQHASVEQLQEQIGSIAARLAKADGKSDDADRVEALRLEINRSLAPLMERDRGHEGIREVVQDVLAPLLEKERRGQALKGIQSTHSQRHLPQLLNSIARRGGFSAVLLSDEVGLPLAASAGARDADVLAGVSSLILTLADRVVSSGNPAPNAVLIRDDSNQLILHRVFAAGGERFLVTAVAKGVSIAPDALDPALDALEKALDSRSAA